MSESVSDVNERSVSLTFIPRITSVWNRGRARLRAKGNASKARLAAKERNVYARVGEGEERERETRDAGGFGNLSRLRTMSSGSTTRGTLAPVYRPDDTMLFLTWSFFIFLRVPFGH